MLDIIRPLSLSFVRDLFGKSILGKRSSLYVSQSVYPQTDSKTTLENGLEEGFAVPTAVANASFV